MTEKVGTAGGARLLRGTAGFAVASLFVWLVLRQTSLDGVSTAVESFDPLWLAPAIGCLVVGYIARITRWWLMLRFADPSLPWRAASGRFLASIALNNVVPLRAGDVYRAFCFRGRRGLEASRVLGTLVVERLLDMSALLLVLFLVLPVVPADAVPEQLLWGASVAAALCGAAIIVFILLSAYGKALASAFVGRWVTNRNLRKSLLGITENFVDSIRDAGGRTHLGALLALTPIAWIFEGGVFLSVAQGMEVAGGAPAAFFAFASATLSTLLPGSPGYVGTFHFFAAQSVAAFGTETEIAVAFAILAHFILWACTTVAGAIAFLIIAVRKRVK